MKLYSMTLLPQPKDHTKKSTWEMERIWHITRVKQLEMITKRLKSKTEYDKIARILCSVPANKLELQERLYTVKFGHDGLIWDNRTPIYNKIVHKLNTVEK
jgi:hypothetical protein